MRKLLVGLTAMALTAFVGCSGQGTSGGPGKTNASQREPIIGKTDETFTLDTPSLSTKLKQGEQHQVTIGIKRGKGFQEDVALKLEGLPSGVTVEPSAPTIKASDTEVKLMLKAADSAAVGDAEIKVVGHPSKGADAANTFKVTVEKK